MNILSITQADLPDLKALTSSLLTDALTPLLQGEASDIQQYAQQVVDIALEAGAAGDSETLASLDDTRKVLMEAARLRAAAGFDVAVKHVTDFAINFALKLLAGIALPGAGPVLVGLAQSALTPAPSGLVPAPAPGLGAGPTEP